MDFREIDWFWITVVSPYVSECMCLFSVHISVSPCLSVSVCLLVYVCASPARFYVLQSEVHVISVLEGTRRGGVLQETGGRGREGGETAIKEGGMGS